MNGQNIRIRLKAFDHRVLDRELSPGSELEIGFTAASGGRTATVALQMGRNFVTDPLSTHISADEVCF